GAVDLALEAELLRRPDRRAVAEEEAAKLAGAAVERIDAQRTVRRETIDMLGDAERPWIGTTVLEADMEDALEAAPSLVAAGMDLLRVQIPIGRELADRLTDAGIEVARWRPSPRGDGTRGTRAEPLEPAPTGSQRALTELRTELDRAAAERHAYVRLGTGAPALWAPESAVVAAFERIDVVESDPMTEIVVDGVDPDRALADHAFAHRLHGRAGTIVVIAPGPLAVGPDIRSGVPSAAATRSGRGRALPLIAAGPAGRAGVPIAQILAGAVPVWLGGEPSPAARSVAEVVVRRALYPPLARGSAKPSGPHAGDAGTVARWSHLLGATLVHAGEAALVLRLGSRDPRALAIDTRSMFSMATEVAAAVDHGRLTGTAEAHAQGMLSAAAATLERLLDQGWSALSGDPSGVPRPPALGSDAGAERTESFDPFAASLGG